MVDTAIALGKILADELGITDAVNCFTKGDVGGCINTAVNILASVVGGALGKLAVRYGSPLKWAKAAKLMSRVKNLLGDLVSDVKTFLQRCHSFAPGTLVLMANGKKKPIEKVKPGEKVIATDPVARKTYAQAVVATHINLDVALTDLVVNAAGKKALLQTTANHPFWSKDRKAWVNAADLQKSERLVTARGSAAVSTATSYTGTKVMHDLTVATTHTYYVLAGNVPVLVHNNDGSCDIPTLKGYAQQIREAGDSPQAIENRVIAVGQDAAGNLTAGSSNGFDPGMKSMAKKLNIRVVKNNVGNHAEEDLMAANQNFFDAPLKRVASDKQGACGPGRHDCAGQMDSLGIEHN
jgi:hypothetical protein